MKIFNCLIIVFVFISCKKEANKETPILKTVANFEKESARTMAIDSFLYFKNALIYEIDIDGRKEQIWFYINEKTKQILHVPNDPMVHAIISFPNGDYNIYGSEEFEENVVITENIEQVNAQFKNENTIKTNNQVKVVKKKNSQPYDIICKGFTMKYQQMEGSETLFATNQIPINAWQIYGFAKLDGDALFSINLNYLNVFNKNQLLTHVFNPQLSVKLTEYSSNPYEINVKKYKKL